MVDKLDKKIIAELDMDPRRQIKEVAKAVGSSREVVSYRIKVLEKKSIIGGAQVFFNPAKLGYTVYRVLIRLDSLEKTVVEKFKSHFIKHNSVMWFARLGGRWDYVIEFLAKSGEEFTRLLDTALESFGDHIKIYEVLTITSIYAFPRSYVYDCTRKSFKLGGEVEEVDLDDLDKELIKVLSENVKLTNTAIGKKIGVSRNTVKQRIKRLEERGVIAGFKEFIHPQKLGYTSYKLLIGMEKINEKKFFTYAESHPNIIFAHRNLGRWNYECEIEVENVEHLQDIITDLRIQFKEIADYDLFPILYDYKINTSPIS